MALTAREMPWQDEWPPSTAEDLRAWLDDIRLLRARIAVSRMRIDELRSRRSTPPTARLSHIDSQRGRPGDPTYRAAEIALYHLPSLLASTEDQERRIREYEAARDALPMDVRRLIVLRYEEQRSDLDTASMLHVSSRTYYRCRRWAIDRMWCVIRGRTD